MFQFALSHIANSEETPIYFDLPGRNSIENIGGVFNIYHWLWEAASYNYAERNGGLK